tara:strand:- start:2448 stop:2660 length:213 start_codon:yes stop_codon:yes gene_type:complete
MKILDGQNGNIASVIDDGLLLVGLDGFTLKDLAANYPGVGIALHVLDGDKWVPVTIDEIEGKRKWMLNGI